MVRLLITDDDQTRRSETVAMAKKLGIPKEDIVELGDFEEAMAVIEQPGQRFDMAVIDMHLSDSPEVPPQGLDIVSRLAAKKSWNCRTIGLSASSSNKLGSQALKNGACDYVSTEWPRVNWCSLLEQKMELQKGLIELLQRDAAGRV